MVVVRMGNILSICVIGALWGCTEVPQDKVLRFPITSSNQSHVIAAQHTAHYLFAVAVRREFIAPEVTHTAAASRSHEAQRFVTALGCETIHASIRETSGVELSSATLKPLSLIAGAVASPDGKWDGWLPDWGIGEVGFERGKSYLLTTTLDCASGALRSKDALYVIGTPLDSPGTGAWISIIGAIALPLLLSVSVMGVWRRCRGRRRRSHERDGQHGVKESKRTDESCSPVVSSPHPKA